MFKFKGWAHRLNAMSLTELRTELRKLQRARNYVFDRDAKIKTIEKLMLPIVVPADLLDRRPGGVTYVRSQHQREG